MLERNELRRTIAFLLSTYEVDRMTRHQWEEWMTTGINDAHWGCDTDDCHRCQCERIADKAEFLSDGLWEVIDDER